MFLEGEVNWTLVFGILAVFGHGLAAVALWFAVTNRVRHASATDQLDIIQKVAESSDKRLFETMNAVPVAMVETDRTGKFVFANRAAHQLLGRRDAELLGLRFHSATWGITFPDGKTIPPDLLPSARALRGQTVRGFQHMMINAATRKKMLVSVTAMPIENEFGQITGSIAAIVETDVLTTPAIEPAAPPAPVAAPDPTPPAPPAAPTLSDRVFDAASSALVVVGADGRIRQANRAALALLGRSADVVEADFADLFLPADRRAEGRQALRAALTAADGEAEPIETSDAEGAVIRWSILPLADETGGAPDAILLAGSPAPAAVETVDDAIAGPSGAAPGDDAVAQALAAAQAEHVRREEALTAAHRRALEAAEAEAAQAERRAQEAVEAERRMANVGRLAGGVAHDFSALLDVMTSALDLMLRQADDPERVRRLGQAALTAGRRGEQMTRRLSAFSQDEDRALLQVLDLGLLLAGLEGKLRRLAGPGVDLMVETPNQPALARVDPVAFEGAVIALTRNAAEAVGGSGSVAVRLEALADGTLRLSVRDSGPGMDDDVLRRASEPFFTTRDGAAGLGLSQAFAFARQSSGALTIDSAPGEGAEAAVVLPCAAIGPEPSSEGEGEPRAEFQTEPAV